MMIIPIIANETEEEGQIKEKLLWREINPVTFYILEINPVTFYILEIQNMFHLNSSSIRVLIEMKTRSLCYSCSFAVDFFLMVLNNILFQMFKGTENQIVIKLCIYFLDQTGFKGSPGFPNYVTLFNLLIFYVNMNIMI